MPVSTTVGLTGTGSPSGASSLNMPRLFRTALTLKLRASFATARTRSRSRLARKTIAVDVTLAEIHASAIRKLERNGSSANSGEEDVSEGAPE